jgi:hypothetical protein
MAVSWRASMADSQPVQADPVASGSKFTTPS